MPAADPAQAEALAIDAVRSQGLDADRASILQDSNRVVLLVEPAGVVVRASEATDERVSNFRRELTISRTLAELGAPVAPPSPEFGSEPLVRDCLVLSFWTFFPRSKERPLDYAEYADRLRVLHSAMEHLDTPFDHYLQQALDTLGSVQDRDRIPALADADRRLLTAILESTIAGVRDREPRELQPLHGQPHADNVLMSDDGLIFTDFESCVLGPREFDVADAHEAVAHHYPGLDLDLVAACRWLWEAMVCVWCWQGFGTHPNLTRAAESLLSGLKDAVADGRLEVNRH